LAQLHLIYHQQLYEILQSQLAIFEKGISEYALLTLLKEPPDAIFSGLALHDSLVLFQTHFILFHTLYKLKNEWHASGIGDLDIVTTNIKLNPLVNKRKNSIDDPDPLAQYYLQWHNLTSADQTEVDDLLASFWVKMSACKIIPQFHANDIQAAIDTLELDFNINSVINSANTPYAARKLSIVHIKAQYRKLQHICHPDKGGSVEKAQLVSQAYEMLCQYLAAK
jgi:hypothetical protein